VKCQAFDISYEIAQRLAAEHHYEYRQKMESDALTAAIAAGKHPVFNPDSGCIMFDGAAASTAQTAVPA